MGSRRASPAGHELVDHPADLGIHGWGPTVEPALEEVAEALLEILDVRTGRADTFERLELAGTDLGALLVDLLNELVFLAETRDEGIAEVRVLRAADGRLVAEVFLGPPDHRAGGTAVKAATYHQLGVVVGSKGATDLRVFLDV